MAHYASQCVGCRDIQKTCVTTQMEDEDGNTFYEQMYECKNASCKVNIGISHIQREMQKAEIKKKKEERQYEKNHYHRTRTGKRWSNHR